MFYFLTKTIRCFSLCRYSIHFIYYEFCIKEHFLKSGINTVSKQCFMTIRQIRIVVLVVYQNGFPVRGDSHLNFCFLKPPNQTCFFTKYFRQLFFYISTSYRGQIRSGNTKLLYIVTIFGKRKIQIKHSRT